MSHLNISNRRIIKSSIATHEAETHGERERELRWSRHRDEVQIGAKTYERYRVEMKRDMQTTVTESEGHMRGMKMFWKIGQENGVKEGKWGRKGKVVNEQK